MAVPSDELAVVTSDSVASEPDVNPAAVSVLEAALHTSVASVPKEERVRTDAFQTFIGIDVARDEDAARIAALVFRATSLVTPKAAAAVLAFTSATTDEEAFCTSDKVASDPDVKPAPVSVLVPLVHTSAARVPKPVSVLEPAAHTFAGIEVIEAAIDESERPKEVDAVST